MKTSNKTLDVNQRHAERGIALITTLLVSTILLGLGMAIALSATIDTTINNSHRHSEQAFFAADAGIHIARKALVRALEEEVQKIQNGTATYGDQGFTRRGASARDGEFPDVQVIPDPDKDGDHEFFQSVYARTNELASRVSRDDRLQELNNTAFAIRSVQFTSGDISLLSDDSADATEAGLLRYSITVEGSASGGARASVTETGRLSLRVTLRNDAVAGTDRSFSFAGFGSFFDHGDSSATSALAAGTFSGPVHTNTHFAFRSTRSVIFKNSVTQVDDYIRYDSNAFGQGQQGIPTSDIRGVDISSEGYTRAGAVPLPENNFSQEYAVLNGTGITDLNSDGTPVDPPPVTVNSQGREFDVLDSSGRVTTDALRANLRNVSNSAPTVSGGQIANGVYLPTADGTNLSGAGIYVQGDALEVRLEVNTNNEQVYAIAQRIGNSNVTTTITVNQTNNTTTIASGSNSRTYTGVPTDRSDPRNPKPGASLFVNGSINSLRGGVNGSTVRPAVASGTRLTVTAQRDITVTGDLKYQSPVAASDGSPVSNVDSITNVLGIFTNDGNVNLAPNTNYVSGGGRSLEMHAAVISFNKNTQNDGSRIEGSITYTQGQNPGTTDKWTLVGSRVQSNINNIAYSQRNIFFDSRFDGGKFAPPFFPGTTYDLGEEAVPGTVVISTITAPNPSSQTWFRRND